MRGFGTLCGFVAVAILGAGVFSASRPVDVYGQADAFAIDRHVDEDGVDRIWIKASGVKRLDCDLEAAAGPPWVAFTDGENGVIPTSALYKPNGRPAGQTIYRKGQPWVLEGYSAIVPGALRGTIGDFTIHVPCQVYDEVDGVKTWGRQIIAEIGPMPVPVPGGKASGGPGNTTKTVWEAAR